MTSIYDFAITPHEMKRLVKRRLVRQLIGLTNGEAASLVAKGVMTKPPPAPKLDPIISKTERERQQKIRARRTPAEIEALKMYKREWVKARRKNQTTILAGSTNKDGCNVTQRTTASIPIPPPKESIGPQHPIVG